jgi:hypothetical protein
MSISRVALVLTGLAISAWPVAATAYRPGDCGFYANPNGASVGRHCASTIEAPPPQRVTAICRDQSYSYEPGKDACWLHGGVLTWQR